MRRIILAALLAIALPSSAQWKMSLDAKASVLSFAADELLPGTIYATITGSPKVWRTAGGATWDALDTGITVGDELLAVRCDRAHAGRIAVLSEGSVLISNDSGAHWSEQRFPSGRSFGNPFDLRIDRDGRLIALFGRSCMTGRCANGSVMASADDGATWTQIGLQDDPDSLPGRVLAVDPLDPRIIYTTDLGAISDLHRTFDGGATWSRVGPGARVRKVLVDPTTAAVYAATDDGIYRSSDHGSTWMKIENEQVMDVAVDARHPEWLAALHYGRTDFSYDGGGGWKMLTHYTPISMMPVPLDPILYDGASGRLYASSTRGVLLLELATSRRHAAR